MTKERIDKIIASLGELSRSEVKKLVAQRRITVNGILVRKPEEKADPEQDRICVDGTPIAYAKYTYVMLHKPAGLLTATEDKHAETVMDLLPEYLRKRDLSPVGRLDKDTEGLLLITNDGEMTHQLLSPKHHVNKEYYALVDGTVDAEDIAAFAGGLVLKDGLHCLPARCRVGENGEVFLTIQEGKYHQVKRMLAERGKPVLYLKRLSMGPIVLDETLAKGAWRFLTPQEIRLLQDTIH